MHYNYIQIPITVRWLKEEGRLPDRALEEGQGTLIITNIQYDDSGVYVCQAQSGGEVAEEKVTVTVGGKNSIQYINTVLCTYRILLYFNSINK